MSLDDVLRFLGEHLLVVAAAHSDGAPPAAVIAVAAAIIDVRISFEATW